MDASAVEPGVLACVRHDESDASAVLAEAALLAESLNSPLSIVHLYPASWSGPLRAHPSAWHLKTDEPAEAIRRFAARRRITHIVFARPAGRQ